MKHKKAFFLLNFFFFLYRNFVKWSLSLIMSLDYCLLAPEVFFFFVYRDVSLLTCIDFNDLTAGSSDQGEQSIKFDLIIFLTEFLSKEKILFRISKSASQS